MTATLKSIELNLLSRGCSPQDIYWGTNSIKFSKYTCDKTAAFIDFSGRA